MQIDGLIFDLDGTLWDASQSCILAWNSALERIEVKDFKVTPELASDFSGKQLNTIFAEHFSFLPDKKLDQLAVMYEEEEAIFMKNYGGDLYPNTCEVLKKLSQEYKLYIVSNCMNGYIENFLRLHQLGPLFSDFTCSGNTGKPKRENIAALISKNKLQNPVYIGDTAGDQLASEQNGIPFIYARYGFGKVLNVQFTIDDFASLPLMLKELTNIS